MFLGLGQRQQEGREHGVVGVKPVIEPAEDERK